MKQTVIIVWLVLFDYYLETPKLWFVSELRRFVKAMLEFSDVMAIGVYDRHFYNIKIDDDFLNEGIIRKIPIELNMEFDGVVLSITTQVVDNWINKEKFKRQLTEFLDITKKNSPVIICTSGKNFQQVRKANLIAAKELIFHEKIKIKSFNFSLQNLVLEYMKH